MLDLLKLSIKSLHKLTRHLRNLIHGQYFIATNAEKHTSFACVQKSNIHLSPVGKCTSSFSLPGRCPLISWFTLLERFCLPWRKLKLPISRYSDVIMGAITSQITGVSIVYSTVCLGADQRKHQSSASLTFVRGIHQWRVNSPHKGPVTRKTFPFNDVIKISGKWFKWKFVFEFYSIYIWCENDPHFRRNGW